MEFAEPSIGTAFDACVAAGALTVVIAPFLLGPGNDWEHDIPALAAATAARHRDVRYLVTGPLGPHSLLLDLVEERVQHCLGTPSAGRSPATCAPESSIASSGRRSWAQEPPNEHSTDIVMVVQPHSSHARGTA